MEELFKNLNEIEAWINAAPSPSEFKNDDDFMNTIVEGMSRALYLLRVGVSLAPSKRKADTGYSKHHAIIVGHMIRLTKLFDGFCTHVAKRQLEHAGVFMRLITETDIRMRYLISTKRKKAFKSYVLTSYRSERQSLIDIEEKSKKRPLIPIEKRIKKSIMKCLREDGITYKSLKATRNWKIDGKDHRGMLSSLNREWEYSYGFGSASRWIHGGWLELRKYHLKKNGRFYMPRLDYGDPDPRIAGPITYSCLDALIYFLNWNKSDPGNRVKGPSHNMMRYLQILDQEHERRIINKTR